MRVLASRFAGALLMLIVLAAPVAAHYALAMHRGTVLAGFLLGVQASLVVWIASSAMTRRAFRAGLCLLAFLLVLGVAEFIPDGALLASAAPYAMAYVALLVVFGASLRPGREAVVTILARRSRGHLPAEIVRYTRRVTWAWCWFFAAQLVGSFALLLFAPAEIWSLFVNLCNLPLVAGMLCAEYVYRQWRHAALPPERLVDMFRIFRQVRAVPVSDDS